MKNKILIAACAAMAALTMAACDSKICYCYDNGREEVLYTNPDVKCSAYNSGSRGCVESNERMDPNDVGQEYRKKLQ